MNSQSLKQTDRWQWTAGRPESTGGWLGYADGTEHPMVLVEQGEPSLAAQGLRRFFNAIETR